jgi:hypothetical protein
MKKLTHEEFITKHETILNNYILLDEYSTSNSPIKLQCKKCNNIVMKLPKDLISHPRCKICYHNSRTLNISMIQGRLDDIYGENQFILQSDYVNNIKHINVLHVPCNNILTIRPTNILHMKRGCKYCNTGFKHIKSYNDFKLHCLNNIDYFNDYIFYNNIPFKLTSKVSINHKICNNTYTITYYDFLRGHQCRICSNKSRSNTLEDIQFKLNLKYNGEYTLSDYIDGYYIIAHNICNSILKFKNISNILSKNNIKSCKKCFNSTAKLTHDEFLNKFKLRTDYKEYEILSKYINSSTYIEILHKPCNNILKVIPTKYINDNYNTCKYCNNIRKESKNVRIIKNFLIENNINFIQEKSFDDCKNIFLLPFDFYLEDYDILIEYDGEQHFRSGGIISEEKLISTKINDEIKNKWCREHNKLLIRFNNRSSIISTLNDILL